MTLNPEDRAELIARAGKIAVLMGGSSAEREISLRSGKAVLRVMQDSGLDAVGIDAGDDLAARLIALKPDRVFNLLHGRGGEDGVVQGLLESLQIPYTGSGVLGSALSMDKYRSKLLWQQLNLPTASFEMLSPQSDWNAIISRYGKVVVKPVSEGSSLGLSIVTTAVDLQEAFQSASHYDQHVMVEKFIEGDEYSVTVLQRVVLPAIQLKTNREFYDFDAKYVVDDTQYICPVALERNKLDELGKLVLKAFEALGCSGWGRVDVMQDRSGNFFLLEVNTVPGMTDHSLVPMSASQAGINLEDLLLQIIFA
jgi:D-alanine-D-alanine ligase